jgi:anti-sigma regulatory factor (Ser/Thr protein kinase)
LREWAETLPEVAADVVTDADFTEPYLYVRVTMAPTQMALLRSRVLEWTRAVGLLEDDQQDIVMAADEAIANAIEHAFSDTAGTVTLFAARDGLARAVHVIVSDNGTWQEPPAEVGNRGRGLSMMDRLADVFDLHHDENGTTVVLSWARRAHA